MKDVFKVVGVYVVATVGIIIIFPLAYHLMLVWDKFLANILR